MDRRHFMGVVAAGAALGAVTQPSMASTKSSTDLHSMSEGSLYLTKEKPGRWAAKAAGHLPVIEVNVAGGKTIVKITTPHGMEGYEHYIVKHQLFDEKMNLVGETMFDPTKDGPISSYDMSGFAGQIYAVSVCNKHDMWISPGAV